jgi:hypothetical protein
MHTKMSFLKQLHKRTAQAAISSSALRNQGAPGVVAVARKFLMDLDLADLEKIEHEKFTEFLNSSTNCLKSKFPDGAQNWGTARKAINLFLRDVTYNFDLCNHYKLSRIRHWLEVPLDNDVAHCLKNDLLGSKLPEWLGIKYLEESTSDLFQSVAINIAKRDALHRVDLDVFYWRERKP